MMQVWHSDCRCGSRTVELGLPSLPVNEQHRQMISIPGYFDPLCFASFLISKVSVVLTPILDAGMDATCMRAACILL